MKNLRAISSTFLGARAGSLSTATAFAEQCMTHPRIDRAEIIVITEGTEDAPQTSTG